MPILLLVLAGLTFGLVYISRHGRSRRRAQRLAAIRQRNQERDERLILERASREPVDALVIRHLRGSHRGA